MLCPRRFHFVRKRPKDFVLTSDAVFPDTVPSVVSTPFYNGTGFGFNADPHFLLPWITPSPDEPSCPVSTVPQAPPRGTATRSLIESTNKNATNTSSRLERRSLIPFYFVVHVVVGSFAFNGSFRSFLLEGVPRRDDEAGRGHGGGSDGGGAVLLPEAGAGGGDGVCHRQGLSPALCYRVRAPVHLYTEECRVDHARLLVHGMLASF